ncbi:cyclophilin-like fold protein [Phycicoccus sp. Soil802]|uniref:cyclophilin-like fold protein n=1 Tax=Phycicoccus sp. Soil802 TaxID=1736414 RepID=UPI002110A5E9|nr:cyclophilin-like fold protein [Phycicoccus sp. Soil802]
MTSTRRPRRQPRLVAGAALVPASVVALLACWTLSGPAPSGSTLPAVPALPTDASVSRVPRTGDVFLRVPAGRAVVSLDDTPAARAFAAMLPLRVSMGDPMGQAKSGRLPAPIDVSGAARVFDPREGELYYWAPSHTVAIFHDDLGQSVPPPGLVRLGVVDSGLSSIDEAGNSFLVRIEPATGTPTTMGS